MKRGTSVAALACIPLLLGCVLPGVAYDPAADLVIAESGLRFPPELGGLVRQSAYRTHTPEPGITVRYEGVSPRVMAYLTVYSEPVDPPTAASRLEEAYQEWVDDLWIRDRSGKARCRLQLPRRLSSLPSPCAHYRFGDGPPFRRLETALFVHRTWLVRVTLYHQAPFPRDGDLDILGLVSLLPWDGGDA